jgi:Tfp pilus assembly protein PilO
MIVSNETYNRYYQRVVSVYRQPVLSASIEIILSVFAIALMVTLAIRPTLAIVVSLQKKISDQEVVEQKLTTKITALNQAQKTLSENSDKLRFYEAAVPDGHELDSLSKRLELLTQESGCEVESFQFGSVPLFGTERKEVADGVALNFSISGNFEQLSRFMKEVENMDRVVMIKDISIQKQDSRVRGSGILKLSGKAEVYYLNMKEDEG